MLNPPKGNRGEKLRKTKNPSHILSQPLARRQQIEAQSPHSSPQVLERRLPLPPQLPHLDQLLDSPWNKAASIQVDFWLWHADLDFGGVS